MKCRTSTLKEEGKGETKEKREKKGRRRKGKGRRNHDEKRGKDMKREKLRRGFDISASYLDSERNKNFNLGVECINFLHRWSEQCAFLLVSGMKEGDSVKGTNLNSLTSE